MQLNPQQQPSDPGRVVPFKAPVSESMKRVPAANTASDSSPVRDVSQYERDGDEPDDYRHRMKMNAITAVLLAVLVGGGIWLIDTMAQMRKNQDCVLSGRRDCAPISVPPNDR